MEMKQNNLQVKNYTNENKRDDSKDPITIDYYDRINHKWIKVETTKEVARFMKSDAQQRRRKQNQYNYYNNSFEEFFDERRSDFGSNEHYLKDNNADIDLDKDNEELMLLKKDEHQKTLIENSLCCLTPEQREVVEMAFYKSMSYSQIANEINISKPAVFARMKNAQKNIKNHIKNTEN